jgi:ubiquitin conjugation factor E4 B
VAERSSYDIVWLKSLAEELESENSETFESILLAHDSNLDTAQRLNRDIVDRLLIGRLELDPQAMS